MNIKSQNLIILGCQRSGKSTLSNLLCEKSQNYNLFSVDALIHAFEVTMPDLQINVRSKMSEKSKILSPFIASYLQSFKRIYPNQNFILESCQLFPKDVLEQPFFKNAKIICLGFPNATPEEIFENIRTSDTSLKNPYTKTMSDEELKQIIPLWIEYSKFLQKACERNSIPFYETNKNRSQILNKIADELTADLER